VVEPEAAEHVRRNADVEDNGEVTDGGQTLLFEGDTALARERTRLFVERRDLEEPLQNEQRFLGPPVLVEAPSSLDAGTPPPCGAGVTRWRTSESLANSSTSNSGTTVGLVGLSLDSAASGTSGSSGTGVATGTVAAHYDAPAVGGRRRPRLGPDGREVLGGDTPYRFSVSRRAGHRWSIKMSVESVTSAS
jgi:hypothetical protein